MFDMTMIYPWQQAILARFKQGEQRLPHALLLHGRAGIGKYDFARYFSQSLLCTQQKQDGSPCQACSSCHWYNEESHPDFRVLSLEQEVEPEGEAGSVKKTKKKTQISVTQIRELSDFLGLSSHRSNGVRVVLIHPAEALNVASANALLKMLEEPSDGVIFILVAHQLQRLLPTIISRCQKVAMPVPNAQQAMAWLEAQGLKNTQQQLAYLEGSPLKVQAEQAQFNQLMEAWNQFSLGEKLQPYVAASVLNAVSTELGIIALQKWLYDIVAIKLGRSVRYHLQYIKALQGLADKVNLARLFEVQNKTNTLRKLALHPLNHELQIESLLIEYTKMFSHQ